LVPKRVNLWNLKLEYSIPHSAGMWKHVMQVFQSQLWKEFRNCIYIVYRNEREGFVWRRIILSL